LFNVIGAVDDTLDSKSRASGCLTEIILLMYAKKNEPQRWR